MLELVYVSHASKSMSHQELVEILDKARHNNAAIGVTGILLYDGQDLFLQVLEGPENKVEHLYDKIKTDARHHRVLTLWRSKITSRSFPDWKMGFKRFESATLNQIEGMSDYLDEAGDIDISSSENGRNFSQVLLKHFKDGTL